MTALEYMEKQVQKHRVNYNREVLRGVPEEMLQNIREKIGHYEVASAALREQEQREQECEFCDGTDTDLYFMEGACRQMNDHVYISGNRVECDFGCKAWGAFDIKFCPMCGRKLKEGAE